MFHENMAHCSRLMQGSSRIGQPVARGVGGGVKLLGELYHVSAEGAALGGAERDASREAAGRRAGRQAAPTSRQQITEEMSLIRQDGLATAVPPGLRLSPAVQ